MNKVTVRLSHRKNARNLLNQHCKWDILRNIYVEVLQRCVRLYFFRTTYLPSISFVSGYNKKKCVKTRITSLVELSLDLILTRNEGPDK